VNGPFDPLAFPHVAESVRAVAMPQAKSKPTPIPAQMQQLLTYFCVACACLETTKCIKYFDSFFVCYSSLTQRLPVLANTEALHKKAATDKLM